MNILCKTHCAIGEGPVWNEREQRLYFVDGMRFRQDGFSSLYAYSPSTGETQERRFPFSIAAIAFDAAGRILLSCADGAFRLNGQGERVRLYEESAADIRFGNDMKVGPDGRLYIGTQSEARRGLSDRVNGTLYAIDSAGTVRTLLTGMRLSNGMDWSMDGRRFYHTDSDTGLIREYAFDAAHGEIEATGRSVSVPGVDGFTVDLEDRILATQWGHGCVSVIDTKQMQITETLPVPARQPASCGFFGPQMNELAIVTASYGLIAQGMEGCTFSHPWPVGGRKPFLFGRKEP